MRTLFFEARFKISEMRVLGADFAREPLGLS